MKSLVIWIAVAKLMVLGIILFAAISLMPDEAQYWTWAKQLSYGYYSKPPGIAWQIAAGCLFFGDTELGVRFGSVVLSTFLSFAMYWLARSSGLDEKKSFWAAIAFTYSPLGVFSGFFATTDCPYVLFWTLACALIANDLHKEQKLSYIPLGLVIALGALWKWPIYAVWVPVALFFHKEPLRVLCGLGISLLGLAPSLVWNMQTGFVTFQHVKASIDNVGSSPNPLDFLGAQVALVSPILFVLVCVGMWRFRGSDRPLRFCRAVSLFFFFAVFFASFFEKVQGNWAVAAYPTAFVIMALYASRRWILAGIGLSVAMIMAICFLPIPYKSNPFKPGLGSENIAEALMASGYVPERDFLFSDRYQATSQLSFYGPKQQRAYFFNIHGLRHNQFDFWPQMHDECLQKTGYFVEFAMPQEVPAAQARFKQKLMPYFVDVAIMPPQPLYKEQKVAVILRASGYTGKRPSQPNKY